MRIGSFASEYIACEACVALLRGRFKAIEGVAFHDGAEANASGFVAGTYPGQDRHKVERAMAEIAPRFCHKVRLIVFPDDGKAVFLHIEDAFVAPLDKPTKILGVKAI